MSKHQLLQHWLTPLIVHNMAKFVSFVQFYSWFISNFEMRISSLCKIMLKDYTEPISNRWTASTNATFEEMRGAVLADPCLQHQKCKAR
jgi:hypothetical protein